MENAPLEDPSDLPLDVHTLDTLLANIGDILSILNDDGETVYVSPSITEILGYDPETRIGEPPFDLVHPEDEEKARNLLQHALRHPGETKTGRIRARNKKGEWRTIEVQGRRTRPGETLQAVVQIARDVTAHEKREKQLEFQALHDSLTGLPNRRLFEDRFGQTLARARRTGVPCALLYMDLNGFKTVNDTFGHQAGDELLRRLGRRLQRIVRDEDTVARLGGDEFLVLIERAEHAEHIERVADRLIDAVESPFKLDGSTTTITVAVGAILCDGTRDAELLLKAADEAMYDAKVQKPDSGFRLSEETRTA